MDKKTLKWALFIFYARSGSIYPIRNPVYIKALGYTTMIKGGDIRWIEKWVKISQ